MSTYLTVVYDVDGLSIDEIKELTANPLVSAVAWGHLQDAIKREREACLDICSSISEDDDDLAGQVAMEIAKRGET